MRLRKLAALLAVLALVLAACGEEGAETTTTAENGGAQPPPAGGTLAAVQARGSVNCGVNDAVPGFGQVLADGSYSGFDIDFCKAIAAAIFDDPDAWEPVPLAAAQRFTALASREIDVLSRNTTWTAQRDGELVATFGTTTFFDGQGMMVRVADGYTSIDDMNGATICVLSGTTTEMNLANRFAGMDYTPAVFDTNDPLRQTFIDEGCDGWTSDKSQLAANRSTYPESAGGPESLVVLDETFSKEPLGPAVLDGDSQWAQIVDWVVIVTMLAEEFDITQANVGQAASSDVPQVQRLAQDDPGLGLPAGWPLRVIRAVGNYGEIFERHLGVNTPLGLERAQNALYTNGGLHMPPPY